MTDFQAYILSFVVCSVTGYIIMGRVMIQLIDRIAIKHSERDQ